MLAHADLFHSRSDRDRGGSPPPPPQRPGTAHAPTPTPNLAQVDFLQKMSTPEAMAVRLAEASCGSKWMHKHHTKLAAM